MCPAGKADWPTGSRILRGTKEVPMLGTSFFSLAGPGASPCLGSTAGKKRNGARGPFFSGAAGRLLCRLRLTSVFWVAGSAFRWVAGLRRPVFSNRTVAPTGPCCISCTKTGNAGNERTAGGKAPGPSGLLRDNGSGVSGPNLLREKNSKGEMTMFNFGGCGCGDGCNSDLWGCLINLIILFIVLEFLCNIINGNNGLTCGNCC